MNWKEVNQDELSDMKSRGLTIQYILQHIAKNKKLSEIIQECLVNPPEGKGVSLQWVQKAGLVQKYSNMVEKMLDSFANSMIPLYEISHVLEKTLQIDANWMKAVICLAAQDTASTRKAEELKIPLTYIDSQGNTQHRRSLRLFDDIASKLTNASGEPSKIRASIKAATAFSEEFRNSVIHAGAQIDLKTASRISEVTVSLLEDFFLNAIK